MNKAIEVDRITLKYGARNILNEVSFSVEKGHIHGFLGPNGAGKTTTMRLIANLLTQDCGSIKLLGMEVSSQHSNLSAKLGFLLEDPPLYGDLTVFEYLVFIAKIKHVPKSSIKEYVNDCIVSLDLENVRDRAIENLSKGFQQRVGIAQAIVHKPEIVILDEPTNGLDPQSMLEVRNLILKLKNQHTVLLSSHLLHEIGLVCDEVTIISKGKVLATGTIENLKEKIGNIQEVQVEVKKYHDLFEQKLKGHESISTFKKMNDLEYLIYPKNHEEIRHLIVKLAVESGADLIRIDRKNQTLEDIFLTITDSHD